MRVLPTFLMLGIVALAGCAAGPEPSEEPAFSQSSDLPDFRPLEEEEDVPRTLLEVPKWKQGEWWKIRVTDGFTGAVYETTRVVAGQEGDYYLVGMPRDHFSDDIMVFHVPGFGQILKEDLSFETHDVPTQHLRFPLTDGDSWQTAFEGSAITTKVFVESDTRARVQFTGSAHNGNLTYDALLGEIVEFEQEAYARYEVLEHGYNYTGIVTVPHMHDVIFMHFRFGGVLSGIPAPSTSLTDTVEVDTTYDRVSAAMIAFSLTGGPAGYFQERVTAPSGEIFEMTMMPTEGPFKIRSFSSTSPGGTWQLEHTAAGAGGVGAEGIAYHTYDVDMPSGRILPSTGEHEHGG